MIQLSVRLLDLLTIGRLRDQFAAGVAGEFSSPGLVFVLTHLGIRSTPMLLR